MAHLTTELEAANWSYGFWDLKRALEPESVDDDRGDPDAFLPAAGVWILIAGEVVYEEIKKLD